MHLLLNLINNGDLAGIQKLFEENRDIFLPPFPNDEDNFEKITPLLAAAAQGKKEIVDWLLNKFPDMIQDVDAVGNNVLLIAIKNGQLELLNWLINIKKISINAKNNLNNTPILVAANYGKTDIVKWLLHERFSSIHERNSDDQTSFMLSIDNSHYLCAEFFLQYGAHVDEQDIEGNTALLSSVLENEKDNVVWLLNKNASIFHVNKKGNNALLLAAKEGDADLIQLLIDKGINIDSRNLKNETPLFIAVRYGNLNAIKVLKKNGAPLGEKNTKGDSVIHVLIHSNDADNKHEILKFLIETDPSLIEEKDKDGNTPLILAAIKRENEIADLLLKFNAKVDAKNKYKMTPINYSYTNRELFENLCHKIRIDPDEYYFRNRLFYMFGGDKLKNLQFSEMPIPFGMGNFHQAMKTLTNYLTQFELYNSNKESVGEVIQIFKDSIELDQRNLLENIDQGKTILFNTGFTSHHVTASLKKDNSQQLLLTLAERGPLHYKEGDQNAGKYPSLVTLLFPRRAGEKVIQLLNEAVDATQSEARDILYNRIPQLVQTTYEPQLYQKPFKGNICFWSNPKSAIYGFFIKKLGVGKGKLLYKEFEIFIREKELQNYKNFLLKKYPDQNPEENPIVKECSLLIQERRQKLDLSEQSLNEPMVNKFRS